MSGPDIVPTLSDPIDCVGGYSSGDVCCAKGTNSVTAWIVLVVGDCLLDQRPTLRRQGWYQRDETDRRGARGGRLDGWGGMVDTDAEDHCTDPEVDVFRGDAVAIYISHEGAVACDTAGYPNHPVSHNDLFIVHRSWLVPVYERDCLYIDRGRRGLHRVKPPRYGNQLSKRFGRINAGYSAR